MKEVAQRFEAEYLKDAAGLNCKKPTVQPRATEHIQQILDIVKDLDVYKRQLSRSPAAFCWACPTRPSISGRSSSPAGRCGICWR